MSFPDDCKAVQTWKESDWNCGTTSRLLLLFLPLVYKCWAISCPRGGPMMTPRPGIRWWCRCWVRRRTKMELKISKQWLRLKAEGVSYPVYDGLNNMSYSVVLIILYFDHIIAWCWQLFLFFISKLSILILISVFSGVYLRWPLSKKGSFLIIEHWMSQCQYVSHNWEPDSVYASEDLWNKGWRYQSFTFYFQQYVMYRYDPPLLIWNNMITNDFLPCIYLRLVDNNRDLKAILLNTIVYNLQLFLSETRKCLYYR